MERRASIEQAKQLFAENYIGRDELLALFDHLKLDISKIEIPEIPYSISTLEECKDEYILILGIGNVDNKDISMLLLRSHFGLDPRLAEPCFYNQDWYMQEDFMHNTLNFRWYLIKKNVIENTRAVLANDILAENILFPSAILCAYTFFAYYFSKGKLLWSSDFIWCSDVDHNGDRIYVGKYIDIDGINNNGFSIHRHLALRSCYGAISVL